MLTSGNVSYPLDFRPETDVTLGDLLRRLPPILVGGKDPSGQLEPLDLLREIGTRLWQELLHETAPADARLALERQMRTGMTPVLLTLPRALGVLPWELLCDPEGEGSAGFLARQRPLVRLVAGGGELAPLAPPLRVLLLISSPPGLDERRRVDVESERAAVENATQAFREAGLLYLLVEDIVTPRRVQQDLLRFKPHIVQYIGHGGYEEDLGGFLEWEDDQGKPIYLFDIDFAGMLRPRGLRAVLLHGCETAMSSRRTDFRSVAGALIDAGIPAVLAQQVSFTYESSQRASEMFYTALTSGFGFAEATFEARQALAQAERPDWAVPALQATASSLFPLLDQATSPGLPDPALQRHGAASDLPAPTGIFVGRQRS
jgi:CHAT domain